MKKGTIQFTAVLLALLMMLVCLPAGVVALPYDTPSEPESTLRESLSEAQTDPDSILIVIL